MNEKDNDPHREPEEGTGWTRPPSRLARWQRELERLLAAMSRDSTKNESEEEPWTKP